MFAETIAFTNNVDNSGMFVISRFIFLGAYGNYFDVPSVEHVLYIGIRSINTFATD